MGLTIHYTLHAPEATHHTAQELVAALRAFAIARKFPEVGELIRVDRADPEPFPFEFPVIVGEELTMVPQAPAALFSFTFKGSDSAIFGLAKLDLKNVKDPAAKKRLGKGYHWASFCKTQFALMESEGGGRENFLAAHRAVIEMLEEAQRLGMEVEVLDESEYWDHRDDGKLVAYAERLGGFIAATAGFLKDKGLAVESPLVGSPEFEGMEARGRAEIERMEREAGE